MGKIRYTGFKTPELAILFPGSSPQGEGRRLWPVSFFISGRVGWWGGAHFPEPRLYPGHRTGSVEVQSYGRGGKIKKRLVGLLGALLTVVSLSYFVVSAAPTQAANNVIDGSDVDCRDLSILTKDLVGDCVTCPRSLTSHSNTVGRAGGVAPDFLVAAFMDEAIRQRVARDGGHVDTVNQATRATVSHFTNFASPAYAAAPGTAVFTVTDLAISPLEAAAGEKVTISAIVHNYGDTGGSHKVSLEVNGELIGEKIVTVPAGGNEAVSFSLSRTQNGRYIVTLGGLEGNFMVQGAASMMDWFRWVVIGMIILSMAGVAVYGFIILRRLSRRPPSK
jgi:hypothetical protein